MGWVGSGNPSLVSLYQKKGWESECWALQLEGKETVASTFFPSF